MDNLMRWHIVNSDEFKAGTKDPNDLYFLEDTHEIYRGEVPFTQSVILYTKLPVSGIALNRLYINSTTLEGRIYDGSKWTVVIKPIEDTIDKDSTNPVSAKAVATYVAAEIAKVATPEGTISTLDWDSAEHILTVTKGDNSTENISFDGLAVSLQYTASTGNLQLVDSTGAAIGSPIKLDLERFVTAGEYDPATKNIVLYFDAEKTAESSVSIPVGELVDTYTAEGDGKALTLEVAEGNKIKGAIKISTAAGNTITADENGLYVAATDISGKMDKVTDAVEGDIAVFDADGNAVDSGKNFDDIVPNNSIYTGASIEAAVTGHTPVKGDIAIISTPIGDTDKSERRVYEYDGTQWVAFDENYNAENVFFPEDLTTTFEMGTISLTNGQATIPAKGKNLKELFNTIYVKEKNPTTTQPSVSFTDQTVFKAYEVGTKVTPTYGAKFNPGSYSYGPATGISATAWNVADTNGATRTSNAGTTTDTFDVVTVTDAMNSSSTGYKITATVTYGDGAVPVTNVGNPYPSGKISGGSKSATSKAITGYRRAFFGCLTEKGEINSTVIRGLTSMELNGPATAGKEYTLQIPAGTVRTIIAYPATLKDLESVKDENASKAEILSAFKLQNSVDVEGFDSYTAVPYKVYVEDAAAASSVANKYYIKIKA